MSAAPVISARGLNLGYDRTPILQNINWSVAPGEVWFLIGPNGRGKSTLLKAVLGQLHTTSGELAVACGREKIGFVPQRCDLNPALPTTVREFTSLGLVNLGVTRAEAGVRLREALALVKLDDRAEADYWSLSGGQRQRALLARALIRRPDLLILDEPTNGLDVPSEEALLACLEELRRNRTITILFVTHDLSLAARHATHVALFAAGTVRGGSRQAMLVPERLRETFGTSVAMEGRT